MEKWWNGGAWGHGTPTPHGYSLTLGVCERKPSFFTC